MAKRRPHLTYLLLAAFGLLVAIWYYNLEWEDKEIDLGPTPEARRNPVLALQRLLEARGQPVQLVRGFTGLERLHLGGTPIGANDAVVLLNTGRSLQQAQVEQLWQWLEGGGRILAAVNNPHFDMTALDNDPLLDQLGVTLVRHDWSGLDDAGEELEDDQAQLDPPAAEADSDPVDAEGTEEESTTEECRWQDVTLPVSLGAGEADDLQMEFVSAISFADLAGEVRALSRDGDNLFLLHQKIGAGEIYAIPAMHALHNLNIHCADNAYLVWRMLRDSDKVWLALNADSPSFWHHLWQLSAFGCMALLAALALWLWYKVPRFGPILERHARGRRQFLDHIQASAQFLLRQQGSKALILPLRDDILQKLRLRHPGFAQLPIAEQIAKTAQLSGMSHTDVQLALYRPLPVPDPVFIDMVQRLQHLRNAL